MGTIRIDECRHGILCLTFDDAGYDQWLPMLPEFRRFGARCTFFFDKEIDAPAAAAMSELVAAGHAVGLHTVHHRDADRHAFRGAYGGPDVLLCRPARNVNQCPEAFRMSAVRS